MLDLINIGGLKMTTFAEQLRLNYAPDTDDSVLVVNEIVKRIEGKSKIEIKKELPDDVIELLNEKDLTVEYNVLDGFNISSTIINNLPFQYCMLKDTLMDLSIKQRKYSVKNKFNERIVRWLKEDGIKVTEIYHKQPLCDCEYGCYTDCPGKFASYHETILEW